MPYKYYKNSNYDKTPFNKELLLGFTPFYQQSEYTDMQSLAKLFQNILIFKQGNFPNQPELGVGIEDYLFELITDDLINELQQKITYQCNRFAPTDYSYDVKIEKLKNEKNRSTLAIYFYLSKYSSDNGEPDVGILVQGMPNKSVLSQIYL